MNDSTKPKEAGKPAPGKREQAGKPKPGEGMHEVDQKVQEDAAKERAKTGGYE